MVATTERPRTSAGQPTRRTLLAGVALAAPAAALPAVALAADQAPDPHLAWFAEWQDLIAFLDRPEGHGDAAMDDMPEWHRAIALEKLIGVTPSRTPAGALVQLRMLRHWTPRDALANDALDAALTNALATLDRLAGEARHA